MAARPVIRRFDQLDDAAALGLAAADLETAAGAQAKADAAKAAAEAASIPLTQKGAANGVATLDANGLLTAAQNGGSLAAIDVTHGPYNARGDGVTDDTAAIQDAFDAATVAKLPVYFPPTVAGQFYKLTAAITISRRGQQVIGSNAWYTVVKQTTAAEHAFQINDDTDSDTPQGTTANQHVIFENLRIVGLGAGTATGYGVHGASDGDWFEMKNCTVWGFSRGVNLNGWAQVDFDNCVLHYNGYNLYLDDTDSVNNTINLRNTGIAAATTCGVLFNQGGGCTINGGDWRNQPLHLQVGKGSVVCQVTLIGGNFEDVTSPGTCFVKVNNSARFVAIGPQAQKVSTGVDADFVLVDGGAVVVVNPILVGNSTTKAIIRKTTSTDIAEVIAPTVNLSTGVVSIADPGTTYQHGRFAQRADNAVPAASSANRGLILQSMVRDTSSDVDRLVFYVRDRTNATDQYSARLLTGAAISVSADRTVVDTDETILANATGAVRTITLPTAVGRTGKRFTVKKTDSSANAVSVATTSSQTIDGSATYSLASQWKYVTVCSDGTNWQIVANN